MARDNKRSIDDGSRHDHPDADTTGHDTLVDIAAVRRDDALIDSILRDDPMIGDSQIAALLSTWRAEILERPLPLAPDLDEVLTAMNQELKARRARVRAGGRMRVVRPIAGAAAAIALVVGGMTTLSYNAQPGDPLWNMKQVVFSDQADSTVANIDTTSDLRQAEQLIDAGHPEQAKVHLDEATTRATDVDDTAVREDLIAWWNRLQEELNQRLHPSSTPPTAITAAGSSQASTTPSAGTSSSVAPTTPQPSTIQSAPTSVGPRPIPGLTIPSPPLPPVAPPQMPTFVPPWSPPPTG